MTQPLEIVIKFWLLFSIFYFVYSRISLKDFITLLFDCWLLLFYLGLGLNRTFFFRSADLRTRFELILCFYFPAETPKVIVLLFICMVDVDLSYYSCELIRFLE